jgi:hypothetical protein
MKIINYQLRDDHIFRKTSKEGGGTKSGKNNDDDDNQ